MDEWKVGIIPSFWHGAWNLVPLRGRRPPDYGETLVSKAEVERLEARLAKLDTPHVLVLGEDRWTLEHSLECRESGRMAECVLHTKVAAWIAEVGEPDLPKGRYVVGDGELPWALSLEPGAE